MSIGMVGTLLGFLIVLTSAFENVDTSDTQAMQDVIGQLASGMGTALLTSLMGLISSVILKFQLVMLEANNAGEDNA
jgi:ABC-type long-subunit fatty acid transport system fused permease/ATPase subunit